MGITADATYRIRADTRPADASMQRFEGRVESMKPKIEAAATGASGLSSAIGGVGSSAGSALGAVSNFAGAFATGGPFLAAVTVASTGLGIMIDKWVEAGEKAEASKQEQVDAVQKLASEIDGATKGLEDRIARAGGLDKFAVEVARQRDLVESLKIEYNDLIDNGVMNYVEAMDVGPVQATQMLNEQLEFLDEQIADQEVALGLAEAALAEYAQKLAIANDLEARRTALMHTSAAEIRANQSAQDGLTESLELQTASMRRNSQLRENLQRFRLDQSKSDAATLRDNDAFAAAELEDIMNQVIEAEDRGNQRRAEMAEELADRRIAATEREKDAAVDAAMEKTRVQLQFTQMALDASFQIVEALIEGDQRAVASAILSVARQTGTAIFGFGASAFAGGVAKNAVLPGSGADAMFQGGALMAVGAGIGGASAVGGGLLGRFGGTAFGESGGGGGSGTAFDELFIGNSRGAGARAQRNTDGGVTVVYAGGTIIGDSTEASRAIAKTVRRGRQQLLLD